MFRREEEVLFLARETPAAEHHSDVVIRKACLQREEVIPGDNAEAFHSHRQLVEPDRIESSCSPPQSHRRPCCWVGEKYP